MNGMQYEWAFQKNVILQVGYFMSALCFLFEIPFNFASNNPAKGVVILKISSAGSGNRLFSLYRTCFWVIAKN